MPEHNILKRHFDRNAPPKAYIDIKPSSGWVPLQLRDIWEYRELFGFLTWRDISVRYKQTLLGVVWVVLQPLFTMLLFSLFFGRLARMPSDGLPYPLFALTGLVPWSFFANALMNSSNSLVQNSNLLTKVYFPRLALPISSVFSGTVDFCLAFLLLLLVMGFYGVTPTGNIIWLPFLVFLSAGTGLGVGLWLSAMNVSFRDVKHTIPFLSQIWLFATPIAYPSSLLPEPWRTLYALNPMVGVVEGFRWALLGSQRPGAMLAASVAAAILLLITGAYFFRRVERTFADII